MTAEWKPPGANNFASVNGSSYTKISSLPSYSQPTAVLLRVGQRDGLKKMKGYVLRAINIEGTASNLDTVDSAGLVIGIASGATKQNFTAHVPFPLISPGRDGKNRKFEFYREDDTVPIGKFLDGADDPNTNQWAGMSTNALLNISASPPGGKIGLSRQSYLLSPPPLWSINGPTNLVQGQQGNIAVRVAYPDGEAVQGLRLRADVSGAGIEMFLEGVWTFGGTFATDEDGRAVVPVRATRTASASITVTTDDPRCEDSYFNPPLSAVLGVNAATVTVDGQQCVYIPGTPATPYVRGSRTESLDYGWNAGALSIDSFEGDAGVDFSIGKVIGAVIGLTSNRDVVGTLRSVPHGFYFRTTGQGMTYSIMEYGTDMGRGGTYNANTVFSVRRFGEVVSYLVDEVPIYRSFRLSAGALSVVSALYASGDKI